MQVHVLPAAKNICDCERSLVVKHTKCQLLISGSWARSIAWW